MLTRLEVQLTDRIKALEAENKKLNEEKMMKMNASFGTHPFLALFRRFAMMQLRRRGYSKEQARGMVNRLGDGKILEFLKKYGPMLFQIFLAILPFLLALQPAPPENPAMSEEEFEAIMHEEADSELLESVTE